jgi:L-iditol 2-dehydrogenase
MKAAFLVAAKQFELRDLPDPVSPEDGLVLKVEACGVCGSDLRRWKEGLPPGGEPMVPGHEIAGVVTAVGRSQSEYTPGDRLAVAPDIHCGRCKYCRKGRYNLCDNLRLLGITPGFPGGFAEKIALTGEVLTNGVVHRMPEGLSFADGALAEPCSSVLATHDRTGTGLGDWVLVLGAGPIGCIHIAVAMARGARIILSEPAPIRRELAQRFSPEWILDPLSEDLVTHVHEITGGVGADIVICANPVAATQTQAVEAVRKGGKVILFGGLPKSNPMTSLDANRIHYGEIEVAGSFSYHPSFHEKALEIIQAKQISSEKLITHIFSFDQVNEAFETAAGGNSLKVLVRA